MFQSYGYHVNQFGDGAPDNQIIRPAFGGILLGYPTLHADYGLFAQHGPRVALTMFESTKLPEGWAENLNKCDAVIVPGQFLVDVFRDNGVNAPMQVYPLGVSSEFLTYIVREKTRPFTFIAIADRGKRKAANKVMYAFVRAFGDDMRYRLILKAREFRYEVKNPNITLIGKDMSNKELADLYRQAQVMVFPSCGEGFGLPPREFAATGGVAMVTNWSGTADAVAEWGIPLPYTMSDAWEGHPKWYGKLGQWADVDIDTIAKRMQLIARNFPIYAMRGTRAAEFVRHNYRWEIFGQNVINLWERVAENADHKHRSQTHTA